MSPDGSVKPTPEEKLLRLIRGKGPKGADAGGAISPTGGPVSIVVIGDARIRGRGWQWPRIAAIMLGLLLIGEAGAVVTQALRPAPLVAAPAVEPPPSQAAVAPVIEEPPSLEASVMRPIFTLPIETTPVIPPTTPPKTGPSSLAKLLTSRLSLMGVMAGEPAQAIIEDAQTKKTYFVTTGQVVVEGAVLEKVLDNRVVLDLNGEKIELSL